MIYKKIYLIGFMGSGKSATARCFRNKFGLEYADTDSEIIRKCGLTIQEIFAKYGEEEFRKIETTVLEEVSKSDYFQVISCGGGVVLKAENLKIMKKYGVVVWLQVPPATIRKRVLRRNNRPLLKGKKDIESITRMMNERRPYYEKAADITLDEDNKSLKKVCKEIIKKTYV